MNETVYLEGVTNVPWPTSDDRLRPTEARNLPTGAEGPMAAAGLLENSTLSAHETVDRVMDGAAPLVSRVGQTVAAAEQTLHAKADQLRVTRNAWVEGGRTTVRRNPLTSVVAAFTLGAAIARISR